MVFVFNAEGSFALKMAPSKSVPVFGDKSATKQRGGVVHIALNDVFCDFDRDAGAGHYTIIVQSLSIE